MHTYLQFHWITSPRNTIIGWQNMYIFNSLEDAKEFSAKLLAIYSLSRSVLVSIAFAKTWPSDFFWSFHCMFSGTHKVVSQCDFMVWASFYNFIGCSIYCVLWNAYSRLPHYSIELSFIDILGLIKFG